ncbi:MAG: M48 family metallopeptidase [Lachnospiraceae bacterium]|nr:M48 family metallopeptidase [Lachnospiraceae bacterium]
MEYQLIRSKRRTLAAQISEGRLIIRAPLWVSEGEIQAFILQHQNWIRKHLEQSRRQIDSQKNALPLSWSQLEDLARKAKAFIPERVAYYAPLVGVSYGRITIRNQRTRWGSCSSKGNLNFNCLLMLAPQEVLDSVVVHELCHRKVPGHSPRFYEEVLRVFPEYRKWDKWLKENGSLLLARMPEEAAGKDSHEQQLGSGQSRG